jgi:hypothetical protein
MKNIQMKNIKQLKFSFKQDNLTKEKAVFYFMLFFICAPLFFLAFCWYYFNLGLEKESAAILLKKEAQFEYEINPQDLQEIKSFFEEREKNYEASNKLEIKEIF